MKTAMAGPILGEFGWLVFDIAPHVKTWLRARSHMERVVVCRKDQRFFFPDADCFVDIPKEHLFPGLGRGWWTGQSKDPAKAAIAWAHQTVNPDEAMDIPWFSAPTYRKNASLDWPVEPTYEQLTGAPEWGFTLPVGPYVVCHARAANVGHKKNWPRERWDALVDRAAREWGLPILSIGRAPQCYYPHGTTIVVPPTMTNTVFALQNAQFFFGSNSGPTHLAQFCGCPTFSWGYRVGGLKRWMEHHTNPLKTPTLFKELGWNPTVSQVWDLLSAWAKT